MDVLGADDERLRYYHEMQPLETEGGVGGRSWYDDESGNRDLPTETFDFLPVSKRVMLRDLNLTVDRLQRHANRHVESFPAI